MRKYYVYFVFVFREGYKLSAGQYQPRKKTDEEEDRKRRIIDTLVVLYQMCTAITLIFLISLVFKEKYLYWTDTTEEKIELIDLDNHATRQVVFQTSDDLHLFGIAMYFEDIYITELHSDRVYGVDLPVTLRQELRPALATPLEVHIYAGKIVRCK